MTLRFLDLCVELRKSDLAKDGLFQYRVTSAQVPNSLDTVIRYFLQRAREAAAYGMTFSTQVSFLPSMQSIHHSDPNFSFICEFKS